MYILVLLCLSCLRMRKRERERERERERDLTCAYFVVVIVVVVLVASVPSRVPPVLFCAFIVFCIFLHAPSSSLIQCNPLQIVTTNSSTYHKGHTGGLHQSQRYNYQSQCYDYQSQCCYTFNVTTISPGLITAEPVCRIICQRTTVGDTRSRSAILSARYLMKELLF